VIEARNRSGAVFDSVRLCQSIEDAAELPVDRIRERLFDEVTKWENKVEDDATLIVIRRNAGAA
jgi:serine phosphatase RsbU (regulator of sigma subunit)